MILHYWYMTYVFILYYPLFSWVIFQGHIKPGHDPKPGSVIAMFSADGPFTLGLAWAIIGDLSGIIGN